MKYTGERYCYKDNDTTLMALEHQHRYLWMQQYVKDKIVLDVACGDGYGSEILSRYAKQVYGVDINENVILEAKSKYSSPIFQVMSAEILKFENKTFDIVVSFETLEHLDETSQIKMLSEIKRVLKDDGIFVVSTPNTDSSLYIKENKFHKKELNKSEFLELLHTFFTKVNITGQYIGTCSILYGDNCKEIESQIRFDEKNIKYHIGVCYNKDTLLIKNSIMMEASDGLIYKMHVLRNFLAKFGFLYVLIKRICKKW